MRKKRGFTLQNRKPTHQYKIKLSLLLHANQTDQKFTPT